MITNPDADATIEAVPGPATPGHIHSAKSGETFFGPGLRHVVFASGCPLRCQYCFNPEARGKPEDGHPTTAGEVLDAFLKAEPALRAGGITLSGGEPLLQPAFAHAVLAGARAAGAHTALDTSGFVGHKASDALLEAVDLVLLDIKSWSPMTHKFVTGVCVDPTLRFARRLGEIGKPVWIRFVLVPGLTDNERNLAGLAEFVASLANVERTEVLPFRKLGEEEYRKAGLRYALAQTPEPSPEQIEDARAVFAEHGVETA